MRYTDKELDSFEANTEFVITCRNPLEIEHQADGSTASGICAEYVIDGYFCGNII